MRERSLAAKVACAVVMAILTAAYGVRVWYVNAYPFEQPAPVEHYGMGEWVDLDGTYLIAPYQSPEDYEVKVDKAELMSPREYVERYGAKGAELPPEGEEGTVVSLEVEISHKGDGEVGIVLFEQRLIPERRNIAYRYDPELWWEAEPALRDTPGMFALRPGSTYVAHVPFSFPGYPDYFVAYDDAKRPEITDTSFELLLSNLPVQTVVDIEL
ncbi:MULTISPECIES: hypothetical protein [unclassified Adlercreutzia]|uniref:hypothetical protein n=1 Tax=unclassified Adlercreutzia TaxID=2636013 RepID=UPI0013EC7909|nr:MULTISPECIES: hypothetical protein [unclassified Adlercreutzia]